MKGITAGLLVIAAGLGGLLGYQKFGAGPEYGSEVETMPRVPDLKLVREDGQQTTLLSGPERLHLVFFGFTRCPDVCPVTLSMLKDAVAKLKAADQSKVQVDFLTVDPQHDTPDQLNSYLNKFNPAFLGYTGKPADLEQMERAFFVSNVRLPGGNFQHGDAVAVVDRQGRFRRVYNTDWVAAGKLGKDLPALLRTY